MLKSKRISVVVELASQKEQSAAADYRQAQNQLDAEQSRYQELCTYYDNYESGQLITTDVVNAQNIEKIRLFLQQLNVAKQAQQHQIESVQHDVDEKKIAWRQCHLERTALESLVKRFQKDERTELDKQEQKILDEWFTSTTCAAKV